MNLRPKKLDIYIAKRFGLLFAGTFFICQFVLMMQFLFRFVDVMIGKGLSITVLAQFFWYLGMMFVPQALPLAVLLASLITFGNLGESSELTAIKASGISLLQTFRPLILITLLISFASFIFQNNIGPSSQVKIGQLLMAMKHKNPELEIPEGIFYDGIPNSNLYVEKKDLETGKLYGIMIYRMTGSYEDQAIILADSGMLQSTAEKKHLLLSLWSGEWFENMRSQELAGSASVPYRRETFVEKKIVLDYDGDFNVGDATGLSNKARGKGIKELTHDMDSLNGVYDSMGIQLGTELKQAYYRGPVLDRKDSIAAMARAKTTKLKVDSIYNSMAPDVKARVVNSALSRVQNEINELGFRSLISKDGDKQIREHKMEIINKFTQALSCLIFFFIGASLGAIVRKGGIGIPVIIAVVVYIIFFVLDDTGYRMARGGMWTVPFGKLLSSAVLIPLAAFVTYKANNDSVVFNIDLYKEFFRKLFGLRLSRHLSSKEVIINDPDYAADADRLRKINEDVGIYANAHNLKSAPNVKKVFFQYEPDHEIERINDELEPVIDDLSNTRDKVIMHELNNYPILSVKAHTRPFEKLWMNIAAAVIVPIGLCLYMRMWKFRRRLLSDLRKIYHTNENIIARIEEQKKEENASS